MTAKLAEMALATFIGESMGYRDSSQEIHRERDRRLRELKAQPIFDSLRSDLRFTRLLNQLQLE